MPATWPAQGDLEKLLMSAGLVSTTPTTIQKLLDLSAAVLAAKQDFERATHFEPFLVSGSSTISYSPGDMIFPPNELPMLDLDGGFVTVTSLKVGVTPTTPSGTVLTVNTDYFLRPTRAASKGKPYTWVEFYRALPYVSLAGFSTYPDSIQVTGQRGYSLTVPDLAFQAVLHRAAKILSPLIAIRISAGLLEFKSSTVSERYNPNPLAVLTKAWDSEWRSAVGPSNFGRLIVR